MIVKDNLTGKKGGNLKFTVLLSGIFADPDPEWSS